jgi:hypothetical protein
MAQGLYALSRSWARRRLGRRHRLHTNGRPAKAEATLGVPARCAARDRGDAAARVQGDEPDRDPRPLVAHVVFRFDSGGLENGVVNLINHLPRDAYRHASSR